MKETLRYVTGQIPEYRHLVFEFRKPQAVAGVHGYFARLCSADEFVDSPHDGGVFGNILFYKGEITIAQLGSDQPAPMKNA